MTENISDPGFWMNSRIAPKEALKGACLFMANLIDHGNRLAVEADTATERAAAWRGEADRMTGEARKALDVTLFLASVLDKVTTDWSVEQWMIYTELSTAQIADCQGWIARAKWEAWAATQAQEKAAADNLNLAGNVRAAVEAHK